MKYYSEEYMRDIRLSLETEILRWSDVTTKKMFGCPCYQAKGKLFAFIVTKGLVLTQLKQADREKLSIVHKTSFFKAGKSIVKKWLKITLKDKGDLNELVPFVRKSYEEALIK